MADGGSRGMYRGEALAKQAVSTRTPAVTCACGLDYTAAEFAELKQRGVQEVADGADLLLADCACRSTIAMPLPEARPLNVVDLLLGIRNVPLRIVEKRFEEVEGMPDQMWVALSDGIAFYVVHEIGGTYRIESDGHEVGDDLRFTRLSRAQLNELGDEVYRKFAEDMAQVRR